MLCFSYTEEVAYLGTSNEGKETVNKIDKVGNFRIITTLRILCQSRLLNMKGCVVNLSISTCPISTHQ